MVEVEVEVFYRCLMVKVQWTTTAGSCDFMLQQVFREELFTEVLSRPNDSLSYGRLQSAADWNDERILRGRRQMVVAWPTKRHRRTLPCRKGRAKQFSVNKIIYTIFGAMAKDSYRQISEYFGIPSVEQLITNRHNRFLNRYRCQENYLCQALA